MSEIHNMPAEEQKAEQDKVIDIATQIVVSNVSINKVNPLDVWDSHALRKTAENAVYLAEQIVKAARVEKLQ